jgi:hypothetical protein
MPTALFLLEILTFTTSCLKADHDSADCALWLMPSMPSRCIFFSYSPRNLNRALPITFTGNEENNVSFYKSIFRTKGERVPLTPFARELSFGNLKAVHLDKNPHTFCFIPSSRKSFTGLYLVPYCDNSFFED